MATGLALALHAGLLVMLTLRAPSPPEPDRPPEVVELWIVPPLTRQAPEAATPPEPEPLDTPAWQTPQPRAPRPNPTPVEAPEPLPLPPAPKPATKPADTSLGVTPRSHAEGGDAKRAALTRALLKRDLCVQQRREGRPLDKDCPLDAVKEVEVGIVPKETRPTKICLAEREKDWKRYRDGTGAYPGLNDVFNGKKKCREGWD